MTLKSGIKNEYRNLFMREVLGLTKLMLLSW